MRLRGIVLDCFSVIQTIGSGFVPALPVCFIGCFLLLSSGQNVIAQKKIYSNSESLWETNSSERISGKPVNPQNNFQHRAHQPLSLPTGSFVPVEPNQNSQNNSGAITQTSYQQISDSPDSGQAGTLKREPLPLRKPGEKSASVADSSGKKKRQLGSTSQQLTTTMLVLGGIVGFILIVSRMMKKHTSLGTMTLSNEIFEVLGRKMLDQKHAVHYVFCGNKILVLGTSLEGVRTLAEITDPAEIDRIRGECKPIPRENELKNTFGFLLSNSNRSSEKIDLDKQHRQRQRKRRSTRKVQKDQNQQPAPSLADFGLLGDSSDRRAQ